MTRLQNKASFCVRSPPAENKITFSNPRPTSSVFVVSMVLGLFQLGFVLVSSSSDVGQCGLKRWTPSEENSYATAAWMAGREVTDGSIGVYLTKGLAYRSDTSYPGARALALSWTDLSGNFWLFGG